MIGQFFMA